MKILKEYCREHIIAQIAILKELYVPEVKKRNFVIEIVGDMAEWVEKETVTEETNKAEAVKVEAVPAEAVMAEAVVIKN